MVKAAAFFAGGIVFAFIADSIYNSEEHIAW